MLNAIIRLDLAHHRHLKLGDYWLEYGREILAGKGRGRTGDWELGSNGVTARLKSDRVHSGKHSFHCIGGSI
ncbi:hypothetical protein [Nostoc sp.]|uniref:hypothetical protein n=1 Tax=Nostoc sp. TaxID=1180 RepID=UPI002FF4C2E1